MNVKDIVLSNYRRTPTGITVTVIPSSSYYNVELQRALDASGTPATWATITTIGSEQLSDAGFTYTDFLPLTTQSYWYRARHTKDGYQPGSYFASASATPRQLFYSTTDNGTTATIDFAQPHKNKSGQVIPRTLGTTPTVADVLINVTDSGNLATGMQDSRNTAVNTHFSKNTEDISAISDGGGYAKTTTNEKTGGNRGFNALDSGNVLVTTGLDFSRAYTNKHSANLPRTFNDPTPISTVLTSVSSSGQLSGSMLDSRNYTVNGMFSKPNENISQIADGSGYAKVNSTHVDGNNRIISLFRSSGNYNQSADDIGRALGANPLNLLTNGGGQDGGTFQSAPSILPGWTYGGGYGINSSNTVADAKIGDRSLFIDNTGTYANTDSYVYQDVSCSIGDTFKLSGWMNVKSALTGTGYGFVLNLDRFGGTASWTILDKQGDNPNSNEPDVGLAKASTPTNGYQYVSSTFIAGFTGIIRVMVELGYGNTITGTAWLDGLELVKLPSNVSTGGYRASQALDSGNIVNSSNLDFARPYTNKHSANLPRTATDPTLVSSVVANISSSGQLSGSMQDSRGWVVNAFFSVNNQNVSVISDGGGYSKTTDNEKTGAGRGFNALNSSNRLATGLEKTGDIGGANAHMVSRAQHGVFLETFEENITGSWLNNASSVNATAAIANNGQAGGHSLLVNSGSFWYVFPQNIPFDPSKLYRIRARVRQTQTPLNGQASFYCGVVGVLADGVTYINSVGTTGALGITNFFYNCANGFALVSSSAYTDFTGFFKGTSTTNTGGSSTDPTAPKQLWTGSCYIRPMFIMNYNGGNGQSELDYIAIDVQDEENATRTYTMLDGASTGGTLGRLKTGANDSRGTAINTHFSKGTEDISVIADGSGYAKTTTNEKTGGARGFNALDSSNIVVTTALDFSRAYTNKHAANLPRTFNDPTPISTVLTNVSSSGQLSGSMLDSRGWVVNGFFSVNNQNVSAISDGGGYARINSAYVDMGNGNRITSIYDDTGSVARPGGQLYEGRRRVDTLYQTDGVLSAGAKLYDGTQGRPFFRGYQSGQARHGTVVTYATAFSSVPVVKFIGPLLGYQPQSLWGSGSQIDTYGTGALAPLTKAQYHELVAVNSTATGFTCRARLHQKSATTPQSNDYPVTNYTAVGQTSSVTASLAPGTGDSYRTNYSASLSATGGSGGGVASMVISVNTLIAGVNTEITTTTYSQTMGTGGTGNGAWPNESVSFVKTGMTSTSVVYLLIKSTSVTGTATITSLKLHGNSTGDTSHGLVYTTSTGDQYASMTPDSDDLLTWEARSVS